MQLTACLLLFSYCMIITRVCWLLTEGSSTTWTQFIRKARVIVLCVGVSREFDHMSIVPDSYMEQTFNQSCVAQTVTVYVE